MSNLNYDQYPPNLQIRDSDEPAVKFTKGQLFASIICNELTLQEALEALPGEIEKNRPMFGKVVRS